MQNKKQYVVPELFLALMVEDVILASGENAETWSDNDSGDNGITTPTGWGGKW